MTILSFLEALLVAEISFGLSTVTSVYSSRRGMALPGTELSYPRSCSGQVHVDVLAHGLLLVLVHECQHPPSSRALNPESLTPMPYTREGGGLLVLVHACEHPPPPLHEYLAHTKRPPFRTL